MNTQFQKYATDNKVPYTPITLSQYKSILLGTLIELPTGFKVSTGARFFETRALIGVGENACLNKVDGL